MRSIYPIRRRINELISTFHDRDNLSQSLIMHQPLRPLAWFSLAFCIALNLHYFRQSITYDWTQFTIRYNLKHLTIQAVQTSLVMTQKGGTQIWTGGGGFADLCLTTWLCRRYVWNLTFSYITPNLDYFNIFVKDVARPFSRTAQSPIRSYSRTCNNRPQHHPWQPLPPYSSPKSPTLTCLQSSIALGKASQPPAPCKQF